MAITVCSQAFVGLGHMQSKAMGMPGLPIVVIPHPFGVRSRDEVREIAVGCADDIARVLARGAGT